MQSARRSLVAAMLLAAPGASVHAAEGLRVEAGRAGGAVEVQARAIVDAPVALVWDVLTDYDRLPHFIPGLSRSVVLKRQDGQITLRQSGEARFLVFSFPIDVTYAVTESPPSSIEGHAIAGNLKRMDGRYDISLPPGAPAGVLLRYSGRIEPDFKLPPIVGAAALRSMVEQQFEAMVAEIERRASAARSPR